ncbi:M14 family metallocarboxypeptidase [Enterovibrio makurazakiensis]|uniref:M14 family metallocarboxypeptidase n=1 Tax=Enterovibrio gelatinilyticus TaxID=2899819 RepID=A0ABT5R0D7_9GAMM|nr:M14 family metallocarboxypeptidase [Enterovibrio sp. ZSDZ42]MDD1793211.1 M14 family metallocarboxypeptidase [Enterovibrio sp. ZSDZ42]
MTTSTPFPIGTPGQPWGEEEKAQWLTTTNLKRSYNDDVISKINALKDRFDVAQYGALSFDEARYPQFGIRSRDFDKNKPTILITGGVHGYETSGVHGALQFLDTEALAFTEHFNFIVAPCISPWGYETINRWNPYTVDPNRSFVENSPSQEAANVMAWVNGLGVKIFAHIDLHETTDTDDTEFRPALAARDGKDYEEDTVPDGFYTVGDTDNPNVDFQTAVIDEVRKVTHIAPADATGKIIGTPVEQEGVINYPVKALGLCTGFTDCEYCTTTEVYPDSEKVTDQECNDAQVAAVRGALNYLLAAR